MAVRRALSWTVLVTLCLTAPTAPYHIHGVDLARRLMDISKDGLGQQKIQELFDTEAKFDIRLPLGKEIVKTLASSLGNRFNLYNQAVQGLQQVIVDNYAGFSTANQTVPQECCNIVEDNLPFSNNLKAKVDTTQACLRRAESATQKPLSIPQPFTERFKDNYKVNPNIGWQYFGNEEGEFITFPGRVTEDCASYDNRLRPWYAEANAPVPKDIVIAFESTQGQSELLITQAVELLLNTTNPNDRITVIKFDVEEHPYLGSSSQSPCYSQNLALATPQNRRAFLEFVYDKDDMSSSNVVNYLPPIKKAFDFFKKAADTTNRNKLLVFLAASNPNDIRTPAEVSTEIDSRNRMLDKPVVIQTYAFGSDMLGNTKEILRAMAEETTFNTPDGTLKKGTYTPIDDGNQLRVQLHSYYTIFADSSTVNNPIVTVPYVDFSGLGLVVSLCLPVHITGTLRGVACIDAKIEDIFFNVTYYHQGIDTYVFIIDSRGRTIQHPMLPKPTEIQEDPIFVDITTLERQNEVVDIIKSMKSGGNGSKTFYTKRLSHDQGLYADGAAYQIIVSHYFWTKVPYTDFSLCAVFTDKDGLVDMTLRQQSAPVNYIHPNELVVGQKRTCQHGGTAATTDGSIVNFSGAAYRLLTADVDPNDSKQSTSYDNFFNADAFDQGKAFKRSTQLWVKLTGMVDQIWRDDTSSKYNSVILWRHLVTATGVIRIYPGTVFNKYDPSVLSWYKMATLNLGWLMVRQVEGDNFNLMISQSIFKGSPDKQHASTDVPVAVVGGEIRTTFVYNMLEELYPVCNGARCFVIDENGYVLAHKRYSRKEQRASHLITMEPDIAQYLRQSGQLVRSSCLDFKQYITLFSWMVSLNSWVVSSADSPRFELHTVYGTNVYVGVTWEEDQAQDACNCENITECKQNVQDDQCQCPCFETLKFNFCNNTLPASGSNDAPTCSVQRQVFDIIQPPPRSINVSLLTPCFAADCRGATVRSLCLESAACQWCLVDGEAAPSCYDKKTSCTPYSAISGMCATATLRSHCQARSGCQWCRVDGDRAEGCHEEEKTCGSNIVPVVVPIVLILLLIIALLVIFCCLRRCYPERYDKCCNILCCGTHEGQTDRPYKGDISPSIANLPRAPERPPQDRNGNSYIEYHGQDVPQTRAPTPPSMDGRARINQAFRDDQSIYYEVNPDEAVSRRFTQSSQRGNTLPEVTRTGGADPGWNRANTLSGGRGPSEYLHPQDISEPSTAQNSLAQDSGPYFPPSGQSSDFDDQRGPVRMDTDGYGPSQRVSYNVLQQNPGRNTMALGPLEGNRTNPYQHYQQEQPPEPSQLVRKSTVPAIPSFPKGHPYQKQQTSSSGPSSSENSGGNNQYSNRVGPYETPPSSYQSEPYDLSHSSHRSQDSNPSAGHPQSQPFDRPPYNDPHHQAIDLSKAPPQRAQSQPAYASEPESNHYYGGQQSMPVVMTQPRRTSPRGQHGGPGGGDPSRHPRDNNLYVNTEAEGHFEDFKDLNLSLEDLRELPNQDHAGRQPPVNQNNNNHFGAHGGQPTLPVVVEPYIFGAVNRGDARPANQPVYMYDPSTDSGMESEQGKQGSSQTFAKYV